FNGKMDRQNDPQLLLVVLDTPLLISYKVNCKVLLTNTIYSLYGGAASPAMAISSGRLTNAA
ncbi:13112_t:CDS:2, partial [Funneliformis caledonium]